MNKPHISKLFIMSAALASADILTFRLPQQSVKTKPYPKSAAQQAKRSKKGGKRR